MLRRWLVEARVLPVIAPLDVDSTVALCRTLSEAGMQSVEITLRHPRSLEAVAAVHEALPALRLGAGTVLNGEQLRGAARAGASFVVSPGLTRALLATARDEGVPLLPGVASASEVMLGLEFGLDCFKLFPAVPVGGLALLRAFAGPFPAVSFCPTGGLGPDNFREFLDLPNVICCGGSWMVASELVREERWSEIGALARDAVAVMPA